MAAYIVFIRDRIRQKEELDVYSSMAGKSFQGREAKVLAAYGPSETLEGAQDNGVVLIEFPTVDDAKAWYESAEYTEARQHRHLGADYRAILFQGR